MNEKHLKASSAGSHGITFTRVDMFISLWRCERCCALVRATDADAKCHVDWHAGYSLESWRAT